MKERIIGAVILVLFVVLVVPVFLDGPPDETEIISERVPLPGQSDQETRTIVLDRDRTDPVPAAASTAPAAQEAKTPQAAEQNEPTPKPRVIQPEPAAKTVEQTSPPVTTASSSTGMWVVQLGSFGNQQNAEKLAADLRKQGFAAFLSQLSTDSGQLHRVRIGPQKDRESAEAMALRLSKAGHSGQVVPHP